MADSFSELMNTDRQASIDKLSKQLSDATTQQSGRKRPQDDRFWRPTDDKAGNARATIRFLQAPKGEDSPFVDFWYHSFKGPTGLFYIENCLTSIGKTDPCVEQNTKFWAEDEGEARKRKMNRILRVISNILVIKDPSNPDNEGKVFLYRYGKTIFDMIGAQANPVEEEDDPIEVFSFKTGSDFRLVRHQEKGWPKYSQSSFGKPRPLFKDANKIKAVWEQQHSLQQFVAADQFKSREDLQTKLTKVLGFDSVVEDIPFDVDEKVEVELDNLSTIDTDDDSTIKFFDELSK